ncbi:MAG TPA: DUF2523 domain-containing protein [Chromobacteriaceae bacterium]|nr:DUF2523 domain-containing protein [Chromobacteriaceae bacterium]
MPVIIGIVSSIITALLTSIVSRIIGALGFGMVSYAGASYLLNNLKATLTSNVNSVSGAFASIISMTGLGNAFTIIFSALVMRATLAGMDSAGNIIQSKWKGFKA